MFGLRQSPGQKSTAEEGRVSEHMMSWLIERYLERRKKESERAWHRLPGFIREPRRDLIRDLVKLEVYHSARYGAVLDGIIEGDPEWIELHARDDFPPGVQDLCRVACVVLRGEREALRRTLDGQKAD